MSRFFVGQRVRIRFVHRPENHGFVGREAVIDEVLGPWPDETGQDRLGYGLDISPIYYDGQGWCSFAGEQLEPILPEGAAPSEFTTLADLLTSLEVNASVPA